MSWALGHSFGPLAVIPSIPNDEAIVRLEGAFLLEQNDEWGLQRARYVKLETIAPMGDDPIISLPAAAPGSSRPSPNITVTVSASYTTPEDSIIAVFCI